MKQGVLLQRLKYCDRIFFTYIAIIFKLFIMKKTTLFILPILMLLISCDSSVVFKEYKKFDDLVWKSDVIPEFVVDVTNDTMKYDIFLAFRYAQGFPVADMKVSVTESKPNGETEMYPVIFKVREDDGSYIGDGSGDIWDIEYKFKDNVLLQKGQYTISLEQEIAEKLPMVMEVGIVLKMMK